MNYSKLTWYDLNEIWVCLHKEIDWLKKESNASPFSQGRIYNTQHVLNKVNSIMEALTTQETGQSDYELRIVSRMDNKVK